jgi:Patatin-like phospholipase
MTDQGSSPYPLSYVLREEFEALRGNRPPRPSALDNLPADPEAEADQDELQRRKVVYEAAHKLGLSALCLSGGGIRSASFSLGVIQGLAEAKFLKRFDYLSTVSGGGYIGSWLSAWLHREEPDAVVRALQPARQQPDDEPGPIRHLREYSSFLTPQVGLLSADTWAAVAIILRNIALNWLILIPAIALPVIGLKLVAALAHTATTADAFWVYVVALLCSIFGSIALGYKWLRLYSGGELTAHQAQRNFLSMSVFPAVLAGACFGWLTVRGGTPGDGLLTTLPRPTDDPLLASWVRMILFALLVYLGAAAAAYIGSWFSRRTADQAKPRQLGSDAVAWLLAVIVFGTAIWLGVRYYIGIESKNGAVSLYDALCVVQSTPCAADAKPHMVLLSIRVNKQVLLVIFGMPWFLLATLLAHTIYLLFRSYSPTGDVEREWLGRASGWHFIAALLWIVLSGVVLLGPKLYFGAGILGENAGRWLAGISAASGVVTALVGRSGFTPARGSASGWTGTSANVILAIAGAIFAVSLLILLSAWADGIVSYLFKESGAACFSMGAGIPDGCYKPFGWIGLAFGLGIIMLIAELFVNVNRFSLHAVYRNRLIRAYLGASRPDRKPDGFTGFDWNDNLRVAKLWDDAASTGQRWRPFHVINMTLNLAATRNLAWQQRKGSSFIVTPKFSGAADLTIGYRLTREYGDRAGGITLGTAMAISGAAVSPNMGYHSSPAAAFLLTMFDVRLGWWLGNPGLAGDRIGKFERVFKQVLARRRGRLAAYKQDAPWLAIKPLLSELFGLTNEDSPYVYLSDGGHFEDLGLYEMVRRRCRWIIVCDGAEDRGRAYKDLGNAVRKIWIDLGVRISFERSFLLQADNDTKPLEMPYFAVGKIEYISDGGAAVEGRILYIKPAVRGDESAADIIAYRRLNADFPQQTTGDQWFDEPQIESYRALGYLMITRIIEAAAIEPNRRGDFQHLFEKLSALDERTLAPR